MGRTLIAVIVGIAAFYLGLWLVGALLLPQGTPILIRLLVAAALAWFAGRYTWRNIDSGSDGPLRPIVLGAFVLGSIGFCAGFFGPLIFSPDANQGPLLGILITGPLGFLIGGIGGFLYWWLRKR